MAAVREQAVTVLEAASPGADTNDTNYISIPLKIPPIDRFTERLALQVARRLPDPRLHKGIEHVWVVAHGARAYPNECCGALLGVVADDGGKNVKALLPLDNRRAGEAATRQFGVDLRDTHYDGQWWKSRGNEQPSHWMHIPPAPGDE